MSGGRWARQALAPERPQLHGAGGDSAEEVYSRALLSSRQVMYLSEASERKTLEMRESPMKKPLPVSATREIWEGFTGNFFPVKFVNAA